ncbi:DUF2490 domain-containing protein [Flavobacteriaceae bacterium KMM 6897]|nr:DUF2490 domain-containing protein [Flavobacteriaceae bacterium KMM 6897]MEB8344446.1 DUF2490 domain-containing protein [Flavobacteriaceae bacterium KMM 6898]
MKKILTLFILLLTIGSYAQETGEDKFGAWYMYFGTNKISDKLSIHTEAQFRYYETTRNFNQLLLRTGLNYHISADAIATLGYGYIDTDPTFEEIPLQDGFFLGNKILEHRIYEQLILKNKLWELLIEHRYRLEQRFVDNTEFRTNGKDTQHRARYRLQVTLPLTDTFFLNFYDEIFINLQDNAFGQNRLYAALGVRITENSSMQLGYLKNHFNSGNFDRLQIGVFFNPDLRKKK